MKMSKFFFYLSIFLSVLLSLPIYVGIPFIISSLVIYVFNLPIDCLAPFMLAVYIFMSKWREFREVLNLLGIQADDNNDDDE